MSITKRRFLATGLEVAAALGVTMGVCAHADGPPVADAQAVRPSTAKPERFLLLTDGRLIQGVVTQDATTYSVAKDRLGVIRLPKKKVERSFDTVLEAYRYRVERIPPDDPGERLKLARWCLNLHLNAEAKEQLQKVLEISPGHGPAHAMLTKIAQAEAMIPESVDSKIDVDVQKTGAEEVVEDRPGALDSAVLRGAQRRMGMTGLPVIFDLPTPTAIRRAEEFKDYVHPVLQKFCAGCHNASYDGNFQLVPVANPRQRTPEALRANLDATLRIVDPENLSKSELLSSPLRPHHAGGKNRPIFSGSNNPFYQVLATWVNSLKAPGAGDTGVRAGLPRAAEAGETFAADRNRPGISPLEAIAATPNSAAPRRMPMIAPPQSPAGTPAYRYVKGQGMVPEDPAQVDPREFPLPPLMGGPVPRPLKPRGETGARSQSAAVENAPRTPATPGSDAVRPPLDGDARRVNAGAPDAEKAAGDPAAKKKPKKPLKLDPNVLQKLLSGNANRPPAS